MAKEYTEEDIEHLKHQDFKNRKHRDNCGCGYCWLKKDKQSEEGRHCIPPQA